MLAQRLSLGLGFTRFTAFAQRHSKRVGLGKLPAQALTKELELAWEADLPWELGFDNGQGFQGGRVVGRMRMDMRT